MFLSETEIDELLPSVCELEALFDELWPICRSITGDGLRASFKLLEKIIPYEIREIPTGVEVFDWKIPNEWNIRDAYIKDESGQKIVDFKLNNLHVVNYSEPVRKTLSLTELQAHLHSLPEIPDAIPYVTSYYKSTWGFCISHNQRMLLKDEMYEVIIDSTLEPGNLTYGHKMIPSTTGSREEFLISTYLCHPSMANNELSGPIVTSYLYNLINQIPERHFNYRFVCVPETIGAIAFLSQSGDLLRERCRGGLVVTCCGDVNAVTYKRTKRGNAQIDKVAENVITYSDLKNKIIKDFFPTGSDERQYCSPGFDLPVGSITRSMYADYREYHTSLDNKDFISFEAFRESIALYLKVLISFENNLKYKNLSPYCEPMLGKRGLYSNFGASKKSHLRQKAYLNILSYSDGTVDLVDIANKMQLSIYDLIPFVKDLKTVNLIK